MPILKGGYLLKSNGIYINADHGVDQVMGFYCGEERFTGIEFINNRTVRYQKNNGGYDTVYSGGTWKDESYRKIYVSPACEVSREFYNRFMCNVEKQFDVISYGGETATIWEGETKTLNCADKPLKSNIVIGG